MNTRSRSPRNATVFRTIGWVAVAGMIGLALVGPGAATVAATANYATVTGHEAFSNDANQVSYWCATGSKLDEPGGSSYVLQANYSKVIVKSGSGTYANTIFGASPQAGQTVWADTNGNNAYDPGGPGGDKQISHIIFCDPAETTSTTTSDTTTSDTTTSDTTTSDTTTSDTTTSATTTSDTTTSETTQTTTATTTTASTETFPTEPPFPSFPTEPPATPATQPPSVPPTGSVLPTQGTPEASSPEGSVEAITSAPHVTPPPTSTGGTTGTPSDGTWRIVLLAMAAILGTLLVLTPVTARRR